MTLLNTLYPIPTNVPRLDAAFNTFTGVNRFTRVVAGDTTPNEAFDLCVGTAKFSGTTSFAAAATFTSASNTMAGLTLTGTLTLPFNGFNQRASSTTSFPRLYFRTDTDLLFGAVLAEYAGGINSLSLRSYVAAGSGTWVDFRISGSSDSITWGNRQVYHSGIFDYTTFAVTGSAASFQTVSINSTTAGGALRFYDPATAGSAGMRYYVTYTDTGWLFNTCSDAGAFRSTRLMIPRDSASAVQIDGNTAWHGGNLPSPANATSALNITGAWSFINTGTVGTTQGATATIPFTLTGVGPSSANFSVNVFALRESASSTADSISLTMRSQMGTTTGAWIKWQQSGFSVGSGNSAVTMLIDNAGIKFSGPFSSANLLRIATGAVGTQQVFTSIGWNNGVIRFNDVIEADGARTWYTYNSSGGNPRAIMYMRDPTNGLSTGLTGISVAGNVFAADGFGAGGRSGFSPARCDLAGVLTTGSYGGGVMMQDNAGQGAYYGGMYTASNNVYFGLTPAGQTGIGTAVICIDSAGNLITTPGSQQLWVGGTSSTIRMRDSDESGQMYIHCNTSSLGFLHNAFNWVFRVENGGNASLNGTHYAANFAVNSDSRIKEWVADLVPEEELQKLLQLTTRLYVKDGKLESGVYAQDVQPLWAYMIDVDRSGKNKYGMYDLLNFNQSMMHAPQIAAIQALHAKIAQLETRVAELSAR